MVVTLRNSAGYTNIARGKGTREIIRSLRDNEVLGILIDQDTKVDGVFVDFFGRPAHTATGPVQLAQKLGCALLPAFIHLEADGTYQIEFDEEVEPTTTGDAEKDLVSNTRGSLTPMNGQSGAIRNSGRGCTSAGKQPRPAGAGGGLTTCICLAGIPAPAAAGAQSCR